jgi:hypothetical protein
MELELPTLKTLLSVDASKHLSSIMRLEPVNVLRVIHMLIKHWDACLVPLLEIQLEQQIQLLRAAFARQAISGTHQSTQLLVFAHPTLLLLHLIPPALVVLASNPEMEQDWLTALMVNPANVLKTLSLTLKLIFVNALTPNHTLIKKLDSVFLAILLEIQLDKSM